MAHNRRKHTNTVQMGSLAKWLVLAAFVGMVGLSYVYLKNSLHATGAQIKKMESELSDFTTRGEVMRAQIASLSSRTTLQRRLSEGFIKMVPISDDRIVRINALPYRLASDEVHAVAARGIIK
jgi:hypothetical protein